MGNLYSTNVDEIAHECINIYSNPNRYDSDKLAVVKRLLDLPSTSFSYDFKKSSPYGETKNLQSLALMALISLYRTAPSQNLPSSEDILRIITSNFYPLDIRNIMGVQEVKKHFIDFFVKDLSEDYTDKNFYYIIFIIKRFLTKKEKESIEFLLVLIKLLENWVINEKVKIDNRWFFLRQLISAAPGVIKEAFTNLLVKLLQAGQYEVISYYTYIVKYLKDDGLLLKFKQKIPTSSELPGIDIFYKAEEAYANEDFTNALKYFEQLPSDFPQIRAIRNHKLFYCANSINNFYKVNKYLKEKIDILKNKEVITTVMKGSLFDTFLKNSEYILIDKGIPCKFCQSYISPNASFCPKCGEPK